jgi:hypothetical protein
MNIMPPKDRLPVDIALLGDGTPSEVLYEVVEPIVYTVTTSFGSMLAFASEENASARWIVLAPLNSETLARLKSGGLSVREALTASWMFLALMDPDTDAWKQAWCIEESDLPFDRLPQPGTPLLPEHEPVLTTRAIGTTIKPGLTPASVVAFVASSTRSAVKILVDFVYRQKPDGRPREEIRVLYDLPVRQLAFNSFEIDFGNPTLPLSVLPEAEQDFGRVVSLLRRGLEWAASTRDEPLVADSQEEREAILYAMHILTPPAKGAIETVEVGGAWLCGPPLHLTKFSRSRVSREIRSLTTRSTTSTTSAAACTRSTSRAGGQS